MLCPDAAQEAALADMGIARRLAYNSALELIGEVYRFETGSDPQTSEAMVLGGYTPWRYLDTFSLNNIGAVLRRGGSYGIGGNVPITLVEEAATDAYRAHKRWVGDLVKGKTGHRSGRKVGKPEAIPYGEDPTFRIRKGAAISLAVKDAVKLPGIATPIPVRGLTRWLTRQVEKGSGSVRQVTVKREAGVWYAALTVEREQAEPDRIGSVSDLDLIVGNPGCGRSVVPFELRPDVAGGDLGLTTLLTLSDGTQFANPRFFARSRKRLRALNKAISRAERRRYAQCWRLAVAHDSAKWAAEAALLALDPVRGKGLPAPPAYWRGQVPRSRNLLDLLSKARRLHRHIAAQREAYILVVAAQIARRYAVLGLESLNITGLMANSRLSRAIGDAGWGELVSAIESVLVDHGGMLIRHPATYPSTQLCSGYLPDGSKCPGRMKLDLSTRVYECKVCGLVIGRDLNASLNLRPTRDHAEKAIVARADAVTAYSKKMASRSVRAARAGQINAAKRKDKAARRAAVAHVVTTAIMTPISNPYSNAVESSAAAVDRVTRETLNWPGEGAANQASAVAPVRRSPDAAFRTAGSGRTDVVGVPNGQQIIVSAVPTG